MLKISDFTLFVTSWIFGIWLLSKLVIAHLTTVIKVTSKVHNFYVTYSRRPHSCMFSGRYINPLTTNHLSFISSGMNIELAFIPAIYN